MKNMFKQYPKTSLFLGFIFIYAFLIFIASTGRCIFTFQNYEDDVLQNANRQWFAEDLIEREKDKRIAFAMYNGKSEKEAEKYVQSFEPQFQREQKKFLKYCAQNSQYCHINSDVRLINLGNFLNMLFFEYSRTISVHYRFDPESYRFFNEIKEVGNNDDLYPSIKDTNASIYQWNKIGVNGEYVDYLCSKQDDGFSPNPVYKMNKTQIVNSVDTAIIQRNQYSGQYSVQIKGE